MPELLSDEAIGAALDRLPAWEHRDGTIERTVELPSFPEAVAFVVRVGFLAEAANHHPDLDLRWRRVRVSLTTHDAGGITQLDLDLAAAVERAFPAAPAS